MNDAPVRHKSHFSAFQWEDALRRDQQLTEEERANIARTSCSPA